MTRTKDARGKATPAARERGRRFCELVTAGWRAATGESVVNSEEIARGLSSTGISVNGKKYIRWAKGSTGLAHHQIGKAAEAAVNMGWVTYRELALAGLDLQPGLVTNVPSAVAEMHKRQQAEVTKFNEKRRALVASLEAFEAAWRNLKHSVPKDFDYGHLAALNADEEAGLLSERERHELKAFNKALASPRPDLLTDICVLQVELGRLRALPDPPQTEVGSRPASMHEITPDITPASPDLYPAELHAALGENQYVVWDATVGEHVIWTRGAFDGLIQLSRDHSFKVLRSSHEAVTKLAHPGRELK